MSLVDFSLDLTCNPTFTGGGIMRPVCSILSIIRGVDDAALGIVRFNKY